MKRFRPYFKLLKPVRFQFFAAIFAGIVAAAASGFGLPFMMDTVFPVIFADHQTGVKEVAPDWLKWMAESLNGEVTSKALLFCACIMLPMAFFVRGVGGYLNTYFLNFTGLKVLESMRLLTYSRLQQLSLSFHHKRKEGDLLSRVMSDTSLLQNVLVRIGADLIIQPCTLVASLSFLVYKSITDSSAFFMLIALLSVPICVIPIRFLGRKLAHKAKSLQAKQGDMMAVVGENLASQREIRAYNLQSQQSRRFERETQFFLKFQMKVIKYRYLVSPAVEIVASIGIAFAIYFGSQKGMTLQAFLPLVAALYFAYEPVKKLGAVNSAIKQGEAALDRIEEVLHSDDEIKELPQVTVLDAVRGEVTFQDVQFAYNEDELVLSGINVVIPAGQTVALVGHSGAGKSSFISMIPRFYEAKSGSVALDGVDVRELSKDNLRSNIALVSQRPLLFRGTIGENIGLGCSNATQQDIEKAARQAHAHEFIMEQAKGYETMVGERGEGLSGGQQQRISIARAFLKDAPVLILDEATSSLDAGVESQIQQQLLDLAKGRTTFLIAHRFSSIRDAERILVFAKGDNGGEIIADGSHDDLYQQCEVYKDLYDRQS